MRTKKGPSSRRRGCTLTLYQRINKDAWLSGGCRIPNLAHSSFFSLCESGVDVVPGRVQLSLCRYETVAHQIGIGRLAVDSCLWSDSQGPQRSSGVVWLFS